MKRKRGELVPIGDALSGMDGPVKALIPSRPTQRHFTRADQVHQLVNAREADPDRGFMARTMALCSLPRTNPGNRHQYKRQNGPYTLYMFAGRDKLPYGNLPRLLMAWLSTEAVKTQSRELVLGKSLSDFMRELGIYAGGGNAHTKLRNQMKRLFGCTVSLIYEDRNGQATVNALIARRTEFWWNERKPDQPMLWESKIELSEDFFNEIINHPVPLDMNHPHGPQALLIGPRSLPVAHLPHLRAPCSATSLLAAGVPAVRLAPGQSQRQAHRPRLPPQGFARVEEDQAGMAGAELHHGSGRPDPLALNTGHCSVRSKPASKLISPFQPLGALLSAPRIAGGFLGCLNR